MRLRELLDFLIWGRPRVGAFSGLGFFLLELGSVLGRYMEIDLGSLAVLSPIIKDAVIAVAAMITAGMAIYGVRVWKRDLVGKELYEVTKSLVYRSHTTSRACSKLLSPVLASEDRVFTVEEVKHTTVGERWRLSEAHVYRARLIVFSASLDELSDALLKARVVMGSKVYNAFLPFQRELRQPIYAINSYLAQLQDPSSVLMEDSEDTAILRWFVYKEEGDDGNKVLVKVTDAREEAEKFLLPYLHRKSIRG